MEVLAAVVLCTVLHSTYGNNIKYFPPTFKFGAATAAYQIEGGWNASDKAESIWDRMVHGRPESVKDRSSGNIACDSYHRWKEDIKIAHNIGLHFYRFSISWPRLLPTGFPNKVSKDGIKYYNDLINGLLEKGIEPVLTLYHWDLPQHLQDLGGWANPLISDWFADYARVVYSLYADRVKTWITINEPISVCDYSFNLGGLAPGLKEPETSPYLCNKHILIAHAKAWRIYNKEYKPKYHGKISLTNHVIWMEPKSEDYKEAAELAMQGCAGRYYHPIYSAEGGWPASIEKAVAEYSKRQGYNKSKLPKFTKEEISLIKGTHDFIAVNYYTARKVRWSRPGETPGVWFLTGSSVLNLTLEQDPSWKTHGFIYTPEYPEGLRKIVSWLRQHYGENEVVIMENGFSNSNTDLEDPDRVQYFHDHLKQVLLSMEDGANITMYCAWSLMDNMEWDQGYTLKYGLHHVDFKDPMRKRTPRASAEYYAHVIKHRSLRVPFKRTPQTIKQNNSAGNIGNKILVDLFSIHSIIVTVGLVYVMRL